MSNTPNQWFLTHNQRFQPLRFLRTRASLAIACISYGNSVLVSVTTRYRSEARWDRDFWFSPYESLVFCDKISCHWLKGVQTNKGQKRGTPPKKSYSTAIGSSDVKMVADRRRHAAYRNKHWQQASLKCQHWWPWMTLSPQNKKFKWFFCDFGLQHTFQEWIAPKWLEINQDNLWMKFSALNVDFSSPSPDHLDSKRPAHASVKES